MWIFSTLFQIYFPQITRIYPNPICEQIKICENPRNLRETNLSNPLETYFR